jgi:SnoaL-like domain
MLMAVVLVGCTPTEKSSEEKMSDVDFTRFAKQYAAAWSGQDATQFSTFYEADGALQVNDGVPSIGREAVISLAQSYMSALPDMIVSLDSLLIVDGKPQFHWTLDATASGPGGTGNRIHISGYEEWTFGVNGLIQLSEGHMDSEEYQRQVEDGFAPN